MIKRIFIKALSPPLWLLTLLVLLFSGCGADFTQMAKQRLEYARSNQGDIEIVAIQDLQKSNYLKGVLLAAEEINHRPEKLLGRTLKVNIEQEELTFDAVKPTLRRIAANPKITAVLGHRSSKIAIPASVIYNRSQVIFMSSFSIAQSLTGHEFPYVFRMAPSAEVMADQLASVAKTLGYKNMVILYARNDMSRELAFLFEDAALKQNIKLIKRASFFAKESNYRPLISQFSTDPFDAIFIASPIYPAALMVKQIREMDIQTPILGNDWFNHETFIKTVGDATKKIIIPSFYKPDKNNPKHQKFIQNYQKKYKAEPDNNAAQGYDSVMLLVAGIERADSTIPSLLVSSLHYMPAWTGITGIHGFTSSGEILGKKYFFKTWRDNQWQDLPAIHIPYLLSRFQKNRQQKKRNSTQKITDFAEVFTQRMHDEDHKSYLLDLAQEILHFKRIGIIYENTTNGRKAADYELLKAFAEQKNINITECKVPFSIMTVVEKRKAIIACFGKLSLSMDALFIPPYPGVNNVLVQQLNSSLAFFKIPAISLDARNKDPNVSLLLHKRSDISLNNINDMQVYNDLLNGIKVNEFAEKLKNLPEISVNLTNLQRYNLPDTAILNLSPDIYLNANDTLSKVSVKP